MSNNRPSLESRIHGCLWGLATGNALGLAVESYPREDAWSLLGRSGPLLILPVAEKERPWDDDLAMAMEVAAWLRSEETDPDRLMGAYLRWFKENGRGAGNLTSSVLALTLRGETQAAHKLWERYQRSGQPPQGNGALMRVAPIGFIGVEDPRKARDLAFLDAALTHWDPVCGEASAFLALLVSGYLREEPEPAEWAKAVLESRISLALAAALEPETLANLEARRLDGPDMGHVLLTLQTAMSVLASGLGFEQGLLWALRQGGDTDTNGAVVGALLGARYGIETIPLQWLDLLAERDKIDETARHFSSMAVFS